MVMSVLRIHASVLRMLVFVGIVKTVAFESAIVIAIIGQGITANALQQEAPVSGHPRR